MLKEVWGAKLQLLACDWSVFRQLGCDWSRARRHWRHLWPESAGTRAGFPGEAAAESDPDSEPRTNRIRNAAPVHSVMQQENRIREYYD